MQCPITTWHVGVPRLMRFLLHLPLNTLLVAVVFLGVPQVCLSNPESKGKYIKIILALLQSPSSAVVYECAVTLTRLSQAPTAIRAAANCYCQVGHKGSLPCSCSSRPVVVLLLVSGEVLALLKTWTARQERVCHVPSHHDSVRGRMCPMCFRLQHSS